MRFDWSSFTTARDTLTYVVVALPLATVLQKWEDKDAPAWSDLFTSASAVVTAYFAQILIVFVAVFIYSGATTLAGWPERTSPLDRIDQRSILFPVCVVAAASVVFLTVTAR